jgi:hypothetical protein
MTYFLSDDEIIELTGFKQRSKQNYHLALNNIPFDVNTLGKARVIRALLEERHDTKKRVKAAKSIVLPRTYAPRTSSN